MKKSNLHLSILTASCIGLSQAAGAFTVAEGESNEIGKWKLDIGGFYYAYAHHADSSSDAFDVSPNERDYDGFDVSSNAEIHFQPSITLSNGITIGAQIELEGETNGDEVDESYLYVKGDFGKVIAGSENSAGYLMSLVAPSAINLTDPDTPEAPVWIGDILPISSTGASDIYRGTLGTTRLENLRNNDAKRVTYISPTIAGFTLGGSYANDPNQDNFGPTDCESTSCEFWDVALRYAGEFGGIGIKASARHGSGKLKSFGNSDETTAEVYGGGLHLTLAGLTIGGSYAEQRVNDSAVDDSGRHYDLGILYEVPDSPWSFSLTQNEGRTDDLQGANVLEEELTFTIVGANYQFNKHVAAQIFAIDAELERDYETPTNNDVDGEAIGVALKIDL